MILKQDTYSTSLVLDTSLNLVLFVKLLHSIVMYYIFFLLPFYRHHQHLIAC